MTYFEITFEGRKQKLKHTHINLNWSLLYKFINYYSNATTYYYGSIGPFQPMQNQLSVPLKYLIADNRYF